MFPYQMVQIYLEGIFQNLDHARTAMFEAVQNSNASKDALVEAKLADTQKYLKEINAKFSEMKVQMDLIKNQQNIVD